MPHYQPAPAIRQGTQQVNLLTSADPLPDTVASYARWRTGLSWRSTTLIAAETRIEALSHIDWCGVVSFGTDADRGLKADNSGYGTDTATAPNGGDGIGGSDYVHPSVAGQANVVAPTIRAGLNDLLDFLVPPTVVSPSTVSASATVPAPTVSADNGGVVVKMWNGSTWVTVTPVVM